MHKLYAFIYAFLNEFPIFDDKLLTIHNTPYKLLSVLLSPLGRNPK
jgi:hypothetical protein